MNAKKKTLAASKLYVILGPEDADRLGLGPERLAEEAIRGGADVVQWRDKRGGPDEIVRAAKAIAPVARKRGAIFIVNDSPEAAAAAGADGVHVGQDDLSIKEARAVMGPGRIVGRSTHSPEQALRAEKEGADYIGFGPIFSTPTKPDYRSTGLDAIRRVAREVRIPFFVIGGIDRSNIREALERGATRAAVVRAAVKGPEIRKAVSELKHELEETIGGR